MKQQEQAEWDDVNKLLQHHGFKPVQFADPAENKILSDLTLLDKKSAGEIRTTLRTMLTDSERRQVLIQELIKSNNQLKEEVHEHTSRSAQQSQRTTELEGLLDVVRTRVQELEDCCFSKAVQQHSHKQQLQQEKQDAQNQCQVLEQKLSKQREEAAQLERKLYFTIKEEERRLARQSRTFQHICNKVSQQTSPADQQVLDVIDFYETKLTQLLEELRSVKGEPEGSLVFHQAGTKKASSNFTPSFKTILKAYQEQQKGSKTQIEELKREVECLKQELETRPTLREVKFYKHKLRRLEGSNKHNNTRLPKEDNKTEISSHQLQDLQKALNKLAGRLMPWQPSGGGQNAAEAVKVEDMMLVVDTLLENTSTDDEKVLRSPTQYTLGSMVSHFQKLFDVTSLSGVYPRMNEVYTKMGEMTNTMRNLRDVLELDSRVPLAELVNQVARLVSSTKHTAGFQSLLGDADIDSIIVKVKQHEEFFPAFHTLIMDILHTLGVSHLDDIIPALKSLKQTAH